jgi:hypothetical protein
VVIAGRQAEQPPPPYAPAWNIVPGQMYVRHAEPFERAFERAAPIEHHMPPRSAPFERAAPIEHHMMPARSTYENNMLLHLAEAAYLRVMLGRGGGRGGRGGRGRGKKNVNRGVSNVNHYYR